MNLGANRLSDYLSRRGMTQAEFARAVESTPPTIHRLLQGESGPSVDLAVRIKQYTDGYIIPEDWTKAAGGSAA